MCSYMVLLHCLRALHPSDYFVQFQSIKITSYAYSARETLDCCSKFIFSLILLMPKVVVSVIVAV